MRGGALALTNWAVAVMLSLARSRYTLAVQFAFLATNGVGVLLSTIYNASTPDLYPNNAHHKLGWIVTWVVCAQVLIGLLGKVSGAFNGGNDYHARHVVERRSFFPVPTEAMAEHCRDQPQSPHRLSNDSGQGTEPNTESRRASDDESSVPFSPRHKEYVEDGDDEYDDDMEARLPSSLPRPGRARSLVTKAASMISSRAWKVLIFAYNFVDRTSLILGFIAFCLGIIAYGRFFVSFRIARSWLPVDCSKPGRR